MLKQKIIKTTGWYTREVCEQCGKLFPDYHFYDACPACGQSGKHDWSHADAKIITIRRATLQRGILPWRRFDVYEGKDEFTKQWLEKNKNVQVNR